jgi:hypothetical protein
MKNQKDNKENYEWNVIHNCWQIVLNLGEK